MDAYTVPKAHGRDVDRVLLCGDAKKRATLPLGPTYGYLRNVFGTAVPNRFPRTLKAPPFP